MNFRLIDVANHNDTNVVATDYQRVTVASVTAMGELGSCLARACLPGTTIYLCGELGAGKTTLVRGFLRELGYQGRVKSPTFTILESYQVADKLIVHFDLYRFQTPTEWEGIGASDYFNGKSIGLIEWPEMAQGMLPPSDLCCDFSFTDKLDERVVMIRATSGLGEYLVGSLFIK